LNGKQVQRWSLHELCSAQGDARKNTFWSTRVESPAGAILARLRNRQFEGVADRLSEFQPTSLDPLFHLFFCMRSRSPGVPRSWGGLSESEHVAVLSDRDQSGRLLAELRGYWRPVLIRTDAAQSMALTDYTVLPLEPIDGRGVLCLPICPTRALLMVDRRISDLRRVERMLASLDLADVTHGNLATAVVLLPPDVRDWSDPEAQADTGGPRGYVHRMICRWRPMICLWAQQTDLSD